MLAAVSLHRAGQLDEAERAYQRLLAEDPAHVEALQFLGVLQHQRGFSAEAVRTLQRAIALAPHYADAHNNLGNVLKETNQLEPALAAYRRAVAADPRHADAWNNLGVLLKVRGQYDDADAAYGRALAANPALAAAWQNRGNVLARVGRLDEAAAAFAHVLTLRPGNTAAYDALGKALYRARRTEQAVRIYQQWLDADPTSSVARHMLAACTGHDVPARASDGYVRNVFDDFASSFDQVLDELAYRAPALIAELLARVLPPGDASLAVADAGCGTGLCAEFLRPRARYLAGVDLSTGMLARARARGVYDDLIEAELATWLMTQAETYDLIVSADTLCYFGALDVALAGARHALRPEGRLVFTVEKARAGTVAFDLHPSGRYSHSESGVRAALVGAQLAGESIETVVLRKEGGRDVDGLLVSARRPA